jgi:hypothetical protein
MMRNGQQTRKEGRNTERGHPRKVQREEESTIRERWRMDDTRFEQRENHKVESSLHDTESRENELVLTEPSIT